MKNLRLVTRLPQQLQLQLDGETLVASAVDAERRRAFFASSANFVYTVQLPAASAQGQVFNSTPRPFHFGCSSCRISRTRGEVFVSFTAYRLHPLGFLLLATLESKQTTVTDRRFTASSDVAV